MKKKKLMKAFDLVDEKYVEEAAPAKKKAKINVIKWGTIAASILVVIGIVGATLFTPYDQTPPDVDEHEENEYYPIIEKLNQLTYTPPKYDNLFDFIIGSISDALSGGLKGEVSVDDGVNEDMEMDAVPEAPSEEAPEDVTGDKENGSYEEVTDNQVSGVTEADRIKRSDKYIYYLSYNSLYVYEIAGEDTACVGSYKLEGEDKEYFHSWEFYLSKDCKTITLVAPSYDDEYSTGVVELISLDVTDPSSITEKGRVSVRGGHISTRIKDGKVLLMTNFRVQLENGKPDFSDEYSFIPSIDKGEGFELLPMKDIIAPETLTSARYTVICKLDEATLEFEDATALMSYSEKVYVSTDKIFATHGYTKSEDNDDAKVNKSVTDISAISYNEEKMKYLGSVTVEGYVKDQYSLDEYDGMLRVVTTTDSNVERIYKDGAGLTSVELVGTSANLYCISLDNFEIVATVEKFAPVGETVRSVRFDGTAAYVCTAVQLKDPVFFFDLSDVNNITYKETGTIEGFSTSLVNFGNGYLLGIGVGNGWGSLKIEVYEESEYGVVSVAAYELENAYYAEDYKSYYINRDKQMVGLGAEVFSEKYSDESPDRYILVRFDGYGIYELLNVELPGYTQYKRGVYIDGYMYMLSEDICRVEYIG